jgi:dTDP-glucose 4,6-dehydratase
MCLDNFLTGAPANIAHLIGEPRFRLIKCDVTDFVHVPGPVDLVLHLASAASPADYLRLPIETLKVGSLGTLHALGLAAEKGARFVLASTSEVYGIRSSIPSARVTGATSTRSARAASMTKPNAMPKR